MRINERESLAATLPTTRALLAGTRWPATPGRLQRSGAAPAAVLPRSQRRSRCWAVLRHLAGLVRTVAGWPERRREIDRLSAMSDHELADIGLNRSEVRHVFDPEFVRACARREAVSTWT